MAGFEHTANHGNLYIVIGNLSFPLMDPRWRCLNLADVRSVTTRGSSVIIPTATGRRSRRRFVDESIVPLEMLVRSDAGPGGANVAPENRWSQLKVNTDLLATIATPPTTNAGRLALYVSGPGAPGAYADVFVENFSVTAAREIGGLANRVTFDLVIPAGKFA